MKRFRDGPMPARGMGRGGPVPAFAGRGAGGRGAAGDGGGRGAGGGPGSKLPVDPVMLQEVLMHKKLAGVLIGTSGANVGRIRRESRCKIHVAEPRPGSGDRQVVELSGTGEQIDKALGLIRELLHDFDANYSIEVAPNLRAMVEVYPEMVGSVLGRGGQTIKTMREKTGARMRVLDLNPGDVMQYIEIVGNVQQVKAGYEWVRSILERFDPGKVMGGRGAGPGPMGPMAPMGGRGWPHGPGGPHGPGFHDGPPGMGGHMGGPYEEFVPGPGDMGGMGPGMDGGEGWEPANKRPFARRGPGGFMEEEYYGPPGNEPGPIHRVSPGAQEYMDAPVMRGGQGGPQMGPGGPMGGPGMGGPGMGGPGMGGPGMGGPGMAGPGIGGPRPMMRSGDMDPRRQQNMGFQNGPAGMQQGAARPMGMQQGGGPGPMGQGMPMGMGGGGGGPVAIQAAPAAMPVQQQQPQQQPSLPTGGAVILMLQPDGTYKPAQVSMVYNQQNAPVAQMGGQGMDGNMGGQNMGHMTQPAMQSMPMQGQVQMQQPMQQQAVTYSVAPATGMNSYMPLQQQPQQQQAEQSTLSLPAGYTILGTTTTDQLHQILGQLQPQGGQQQQPQQQQQHMPSQPQGQLQQQMHTYVYPPQQQQQQQAVPQQQMQYGGYR